MIPLAVPNLSGREAEYLQQCITTGYVSSVGPFVTRMESLIAQATGAEYAVATSAGTTGLHLALVGVGVRPGDLVILPSFTFIASANAISHAGALPWLFDMTRESWTLDVGLVDKNLRSDTVRRNGELIHKGTGRRVGAIMPVYTLGMPADIELLNALAQEFQLPIVADAAAALGARYNDRNIGGLTQLSVLSFNGNKTVTSGGGGAVIGTEPGLMAHIRHLCTTARRGPDYDHDAVGFNYRMTNLEAAVGCAQIERLDELVAAKRRISTTYRAQLSDVPGLDFFPQPNWAQGACWFSGVVLDPKRAEALDEICAMLRVKGIEARRFWKPIREQAPYRAAPVAPTPVTDDIWRRILTLPSSTNLTETDQAYVIQVAHDVLR
jgi:perosamine synthetase